MFRRILCTAFVTTLLIIGLFFACSGLRTRAKNRSERLVYDGDSGGLKKSQVVSALDEPVNGEKNVIWCGSFALAWKKMNHEIIREPVRLANGNEIAERLNRELFSESDIQPESFYASAGLVKEGIVERIFQEMAARFPQVQPTVQAGPLDEIITYAYLTAEVEFTTPFLHEKKRMKFVDSRGKTTSVSAFGIWKWVSGMDEIREQVEVLYQSGQGPTESDRNAEFAVDLSRKTKPNQIILASVPFQGSLKATADYVEAKIREQVSDYSVRYLGELDVLLAPEMQWRISHHFTELEGTDKRLLNPGFEDLFIRSAVQDVKFILNRRGAKLESEAQMAVAGESISKPRLPRYFIFDHPFLLMMKLRGKSNPIFVIWVANGELIKPRSWLGF